MNSNDPPAGILLVNKPKNKTSFSLIRILRRILNTQKIGHAGTLDPFATGVMVLLIGREYTRLSDKFLACDKEYLATLHLGIETDTYDCEGKITATNPYIPTESELSQALSSFQGNIMQVPPMFSAKKVDGKKLYELARRGVEIERKAVQISLKTHFLRYEYPYLDLRIECSKGTYIRSLAHDLGANLKCGAHLKSLQRIRSGTATIDACLNGEILWQPDCQADRIKELLIHRNNCKIRWEFCNDFKDPHAYFSSPAAS